MSDSTARAELPGSAVGLFVLRSSGAVCSTTCRLLKRDSTRFSSLSITFHTAEVPTTAAWQTRFSNLSHGRKMSNSMTSGLEIVGEPSPSTAMELQYELPRQSTADT